VTELLSPSLITICSESFLNVEKFGAAAAAAVRAQAVGRKGSQSSVVARAAVAVAFFTLHHSFIRL